MSRRYRANILDMDNRSKAGYLTTMNSNLISYAHCHRCGTAYTELVWPRTCPSCSFMVWRPIHPVSVLIQPVVGPLFNSRIGVVLGRRGINPHKGSWALPGGFVEFGEKGEHAAPRELYEEMYLTAGKETFSHTYADDEGHFLMFFHAEPLPVEEVERNFKPTHECSEMVITYEPQQLAFQSHTEALEMFFRKI